MPNASAPKVDVIVCAETFTKRHGEREQGGRDRHVEQHPEHVVVGGLEEAEDEAREGADEELAVAAPVAVGVVEVGQVGRARVEVVTVLGAADARLAVVVADERERRLAVDALHRQQRADRRAPAALALQDHAAGERAGHRPEQQQGAQRAAVVEADLAQDHEADERADGDHVAVLLEPVRRVQRPW